MKEWHKLSLQEVIETLETDPEKGLDLGEASKRLARYGPNELIERGARSAWRILFEQFSETMVIVLLIAALISGLLGEAKDAIAIMAIVILNALLGFRQEYQAERAMAALKKLAVPLVRVRRAGHIHEISARDLVPGDVILLEAGNIVPADCRLIESVNLRVQEAALTGESEPVSKDAAFQPPVSGDEDEHHIIPVADRLNMVFMGTVATYGRGAAVVTQTGMDTQLGAIAEMLQTTVQERTPLQKRLAQLGKGLALAALVLVSVVFVLGVLRGEDIKVMFLTSISMAVAVVPEGMPAVVTIALALGARRMLQRQALIRKLPAVETLGSVTVICSDKTGTLTENRMTVKILDVANRARIELVEEEVHQSKDDVAVMRKGAQIYPQNLKDDPSWASLLIGGMLCNDAVLESGENGNGFRLIGDPTEGALVVAAQHLDFDKGTLEQVLPRVAEVPFDSERKRMTTVHRYLAYKNMIPKQYRIILDWKKWAETEKSEYIAFTKGAVDSLLQVSNRVLVDGKTEPLTPAWAKRIQKANEELAKDGMRVLGVAYRFVENLPESRPTIPQNNGNGEINALESDLEKELVFVGLIGMIDSARPEVRSAVQTCKDAGIRPVMITGDHPLTARYIASELGIIKEGRLATRREIKSVSFDEDLVLSGRELDLMDDATLEQVVEKVSVYARVSPEHKLRIVRALQKNGQIVAMTGDGVNDAPALKKADIGVAMGITGTDVSKEAADMVLLDDNFATIVAAVKEGRTIYENIRKFIQYTLTSNMGEIWAMLLAPFFGMPLPLLPIQILWINLVTDGLPGLALSVEKGERDVMKRPPIPPRENIFARGLGINILLLGFLMGLLAFGIGAWYWRMDSPLWQTMVFTTITLSEMGYVLGIRSNRDSLFQIGLFSNRAMVAAVALTVTLQLAVVYVPFLQGIFKTSALPLRELLICFSASIALFLFVELIKWLRRLRERK